MEETIPNYGVRIPDSTAINTMKMAVNNVVKTRTFLIMGTIQPRALLFLLQIWGLLPISSLPDYTGATTLMMPEFFSDEHRFFAII